MRFVWPAMVVAFFCLPLFLGLGRTDLRGDEAIYSFGVVRILETGDWLFPKSSPDENAPFLEKPPLKFWIVAAPIRLGLLPNNEFGLRFWDALFGSVALLYVFAVGRRMAGPICGAVAVLVLVTQGPLLFEHGLRSNNMEGPLFLAYCGGIYHYLRWTTADARASRWRHIAAAAACFFLGFMTKFVAVLFLPLVLATASVIVGPYRARLARDWWRWLVGLLGALALAAPWFVAAHLRFGEDFWHVILAEHVYRRFTAYVDPAHVQPWYFYFVTLYRTLERSSSMSLVLPGLILVAARTAHRRWPEGILVLVWGILPVGLMSLTTSKLEHYAYPFLPPIALAAGCFPQWILTTGQRRFLDLMKNYERRAAGSLSPFLIAMRRPAMRLALLSAAAVLAALAVATTLYGTVRLSIGGVLLLRTSGALRPWLIALLLTALAGRPARVASIGIPLLIVGLLPMAVYRNTVTRTLIEQHPLRSARDCMRQVQSKGPLSAPRGLYVDAASALLRHEDVFYFRRVRPFDLVQSPSDAALYTAIYRPGAQRPVVLSEARYRGLREALRTGDPRIVDALIQGAGATASEILAHGSEPPPSMIRTAPMNLLLLPGPYATCGKENAAGVSGR